MYLLDLLQSRIVKLKDGKERPNCSWVMFRATDHKGSINFFLTCFYAGVHYLFYQPIS